MHRFDLTKTPHLVRFSTEEAYLSVAIDWALILGERWWEGSPRSYKGFGSVRAAPLDLGDSILRRAARDLGGGFLRVGGSESDRMVFEPETIPQGRRRCPSILSAERWAEVMEFSRSIEMQLFTTVSAGRCSRDESGRWQGDSFRRWAAGTAATRRAATAAGTASATRPTTDAPRLASPVAIWELGNEVNGFPFIFGPRTRVTSRQYAEDYRLFRRIAGEYTPTARCAGPAAAVWPVLGEPGPIMSGVSKRLGAELDILSWHYYPFQSRRGRLATRRWKSSIRRQTVARGSARYRASRVRRYARRSGVPRVWLSETGHALFGGEPGRSDRYMAGLWWIDHLGAMAQEGTSGVVRQALVGGDYGLLALDGLRPRPDYWLSILWRATMGKRVYTLDYFDPLLRVYCHSPGRYDPGASDTEARDPQAARREEGSTSAASTGEGAADRRGWVVINSDTDLPAVLRIPQGSIGWLVEGEATGVSIRVNDRHLGPDDEPRIDSLPPAERLPQSIVLAPLSILFVRT